MRISDWSSDVCSSDLIDGRLDATEGDISTAQSDISSLDTRVTTAETDITARPTSTQLAAPEGAAGIGTADGGSVEEALSVLGSAANPLAGFHADGVTDDTANFADRKSTRLNSSH